MSKERMMSLDAFVSEWRNDSPTVLVHTSGSTGQPKPMLVEKRRMVASARITCEFLGLKSGDTALLCLPLDYIAGKMMVVRALTWRLRLVNVEPSGEPLTAVTEPIDFAAMVPLQVYNSLQDKVQRERLLQIRHLIIGGGSIDDSLALQLKDFPNAVWSTYGMTETLSHIAMRRLSGPNATDWYTPLSGVTVSQNEDGCLVIEAPAVCKERLVTNDIVVADAEGRFKVLGRRDNVICSGGVKIQMEEVERQLKPFLTAPFMITKCKDPKFGEAVVLLTEGDTEVVRCVCRDRLPKHWIPRHYLHVERLPMTETGKPARRLAQEIAENV